MQGLITDIQRFCIHDGPGIRTTVFLKGCNLRCQWCHNPETLSPRPQLQTFPERCIGCGQCSKVCPTGAAGQQGLQRDKCLACGTCAKGCYAEALVLVGRSVTVEEVMAEVLADEPFYESSGGGVTLSGGEPLQQAEFVAEVLAACKAHQVHTAIETNLAWPWERIEKLLPLLDLVIFDVKAADPELHRRWTGAGNAQVLANIGRLGQSGRALIARTPVVGGVNDSPTEIGRIADLLAGLRNLQYYELLAYHPLGGGKYRSLGMESHEEGMHTPEARTLRQLGEEARRRGIPVRWPGSEH